MLKEGKYMTILEFILNNKNYLEDLITRSTYHSNAIEGSSLTYAVKHMLFFTTIIALKSKEKNQGKYMRLSIIKKH